MRHRPRAKKQQEGEVFASATVQEPRGRDTGRRSTRVVRAAQLIRFMRVEAGLTQQELAERLNVTPAMITRLEAGVAKKGPTITVLARVAHACSQRLVVGLLPRGSAGEDFKNQFSLLMEVD